tara:strand:+ start:965 stop:1315 length:351 start_codon:yes stop_codon:yes gene_type:complete
LSGQTRKHPIATFLVAAVNEALGRQLFCQNRQASTNSYVRRTSSGPGTAARASSEQTSKNEALGRQLPRFVRTDKQALTQPSSQGHTAGLLSEQTSKQLSTGCPQSVVSYSQVTAE